MLFYLLIFFTIVLLSNSESKSLLVFWAFVLILIASLRGENIDQDYKGYLEYYQDILNNDFTNVEPTFILIVRFVDLLFRSPILIFIIYSILGVTTKFVAINRLTPYQHFSVLLYFSVYFLLFEMTQIRAGVAGGILLLCIKPIFERKFFLFLGLCFLAILFHFSAIVILPLYLLNPFKTRKSFFLLLIPLSYLIYFSNLNLFSIISEYAIPFGLLQTKVSSYTSYAQDDNYINVFNYLHVARCLICFFFLINANFFHSKLKYFNILIKIYVLGLFFYVSLAFIPGIASRISELLLIVEIILVPYVISYFSDKILPKTLLYLYSLGLLCFFLFYAELLRPYFN
jgi:hypothetical protein